MSIRLRLLAVASAAAMGSIPIAAVAQTPNIVTFAVPPAGSSSYVIASAFSKVMREKTPIERIVLQTFGGAAGWPARMQTGEVQFASHCGFKQIEEAYLGEGAFESLGRQKNVRIMATGHGLPFTMTVVDPNIKTFEGLKGKRVFAMMTHRDQGTAMRVAAKHVGLDIDKDLRVMAVRSPTEALQGLRTGRGDAFFFGLIPALAEVQQGKGMHALDMPDDMIDAVLKAEPIWGRTTVPAGTPPLRLDYDFKALISKCGVAAGLQTDEETVYLSTKAIFDNLEEWNSVHPLAKQWTLKNATSTFSAPYHAGAIRYYKEKGVWTEENEKAQQAWLAR